MRIKKKLESDINDLEIACDQANKANADAQRNARHYHETIRELQQQVGSNLLVTAYCFEFVFIDLFF